MASGPKAVSDPSTSAMRQWEGLCGEGFPCGAARAAAGKEGSFMGSRHEKRPRPGAPVEAFAAAVGAYFSRLVEI